MDDIKSFTLVVSTGGVIITAILTHFFTVKREKFSKVFEYKLKILKDVYTPIYRIILEDVHPFDGYEGISIKQFEKIEKIIQENLELVDPQLESIIWILKEELYALYSHPNIDYVTLDEDRRLVDYVDFQYNYIRKQLGLPYDSGKITFVERLEIFKQRYKSKKNSKKAKSIIRKQKKVI